MPHGELKFRSVDVDEVAKMMADDFATHVERFTEEDRVRILKICRRRIEASHPELAKVFFEAE